MKRFFELAAALLFSGGTALADPVVLSSVPAYSWYHGCGPTAVASVFGYWDLHGYGNLFDASGQDLFLTANVQDQISSPAHNAKYDFTPDNPNLPAPPDTSIADYFHTSEGSLGYGWSFQSDAPEAFSGYAAYRGYDFSSSDEYFYSGFTWDLFTSEIDAGRPVLFLVDTGGTGSTDHFVPVFGYDDRGAAGRWYGFYTTWSEDETVAWEPFRGLAAGHAWGIAYATFARPFGAPVPEPSTISLLAFGCAGAIRYTWRRRRSHDFLTKT
jgi:hypothetical protein